MENAGFKDDDLAATAEIPAPFTNIVLVGDPKSTGSKPKRAKDVRIRQSTPQSMVNTEDVSGTRRTETVVYGHRGKAEVTFINIEIERSEQGNENISVKGKVSKTPEQRKVPSVTNQSTQDNRSTKATTVTFPGVQRTQKENLNTIQSTKGNMSTLGQTSQEENLNTIQSTKGNMSTLGKISQYENVNTRQPSKGTRSTSIVGGKAAAYPGIQTTQKDIHTSQSTKGNMSTLLDPKTVTHQGIQTSQENDSIISISAKGLKRSRSTSMDTDAKAYIHFADADKPQRVSVPEAQLEPRYMKRYQSGQEHVASKGFKMDRNMPVDPALTLTEVLADSPNKPVPQRDETKLQTPFALVTFPKASKTGESFETLEPDERHSLFPRLQPPLAVQKVFSTDTSDTMLEENDLKLLSAGSNQSNELVSNRIKPTYDQEEDKNDLNDISSTAQRSEYSSEDTSERQTLKSSKISTVSTDLTENTLTNGVSASNSSHAIQPFATDAGKGNSKPLAHPGNTKHSGSEFISAAKQRRGQNASTDFSANTSGSLYPDESLDDTISRSAFNADESVSAASVEESHVREDPSGSSNSSSRTAKQQLLLRDASPRDNLGPSHQLHDDVKDRTRQPNVSKHSSDAADSYKPRRQGVQHNWAQLMKSGNIFAGATFKPQPPQSKPYDETDSEGTLKGRGKRYSKPAVSENTSIHSIQSSGISLKRWDQDVGEDLNVHSSYNKTLNVDVKSGIIYVQQHEADHLQSTSFETPSPDESKTEKTFESKGIPLRRKSVTFVKKNIQTDSDDNSVGKFFMGDQQLLTKVRTEGPPGSLFDNQDNVHRGEKSPSEQSEIDVNDSASQREWRRSKSAHMYDGTKIKGNLITNVHDMDTFRIQRRVSGQSKSQLKSSNTTESFGDENILRINVVGYDSNEEVALDRVKSWVTETDSRVDLASDINIRTDSPIPFDRHSIAEIPLKIITTAIPIDSDDNSVSYKDNEKHAKLGVSTSLGTCERKTDPSKGEVNISTRRAPEGRESFAGKSSVQHDDGNKPILRTSASEIAPRDAHEIIEMADLGGRSRRTTRTLSNESVFDPAILEGWVPSSPYATHLQRNTSARSDGSQNLSGKPKVRQLSLAIGEEWEDMTGSQPPLSPDVFSNASSTYSHRSHRRSKTHKLSWAGSSEASWTGQPRTFRYMSHPGRLEHYLRRNTIVEEVEQTVSDQPSTSVDVPVSVEEASEGPGDQPNTEKRWLLPNPYNRINQRFHSTLQCPCCLFFCFLCCVPAVYFMQISDKEFDYGTKEKARIYGKKATVLYVIGAIVAVVLLTSVATVVVIFLQEYLTRKQT